MIRKRNTMREICEAKKRKLFHHRRIFDESKLMKVFDGKTTTVPDCPENTKMALKLISSILPIEKCESRIPPVVMRHQIYAFNGNRTQVDKDLNEMKKKGEVRLFNLGEKDDQIGVILTKDYINYVENCCRNNKTVDKFVSSVVLVCPDISYSSKVLKQDYDIQDKEITELVHAGVLTARDVGCYWLSIPQVGRFLKSFYYGRRAVLQCIRRMKYKEILHAELTQRKLPKKAFLGILYHIYDIIGSEAVVCVDTSSGVVLRLQNEFVR